MLAAALFACFGGGVNDAIVTYLHVLADAPSLARARFWGLALRLGQRLTGGTIAALDGGLRTNGDALTLRLSERHRALYGDTVARRHGTLAQALGLKPRLEIY